MKERLKKFIFNVENIEEIFLEISHLRQFNNKKLNCLKVECSDKSFSEPVEDVFVNFSLSSVDSKLSLLGIIRIKQAKNPEIFEEIKNSFNIKSRQINDENYFLILDENNKPEFTVRNIENFGIYIFAGRPDMGHFEFNSPGISFENLENFKNKLEKFAKLIEVLVNEAYRLNNIEVKNNIEYKLVLNKSHKKIEQVAEDKKEIPEALKRFYARIGNE